MTAEDTEDYEQTLIVLKECFVYKIPTRTSTHGYRAADWDLSSPMWTGRLVAVGQGDACKIKLEDPKSGDLFAICPVTDAAVEPVSDSSRYFVMKIEDGSGRHAFIGMGFAERSDAFDFSAALQDHQKYVRQKKDSVDNAKRSASQPHVDYSLPEGTKIHVDLKTKKSSSTTTSSSTNTGSSLFLPPPPTATNSKKPQVVKTTTNTNTSNDIWGDFTGSTQTTTNTPTTKQPSNQFSDWVAFQ